MHPAPVLWWLNFLLSLWSITRVLSVFSHFLHSSISFRFIIFCCLYCTLFHPKRFSQIFFGRPDILVSETILLRDLSNVKCTSIGSISFSGGRNDLLSEGRVLVIGPVHRAGQGTMVWQPCEQVLNPLLAYSSPGLLY